MHLLGFGGAISKQTFWTVHLFAATGLDHQGLLPWSTDFAQEGMHRELSLVAVKVHSDCKCGTPRRIRLKQPALLVLLDFGNSRLPEPNLNCMLHHTPLISTFAICLDASCCVGSRNESPTGPRNTEGRDAVLSYEESYFTHDASCGAVIRMYVER
ncbi:hypothetical protein IE81DRAFT_186383 [Ceraceosorus guamensis]|uniref:Uncharacterized protein n=1 Tax=Ceraceosorus guamensis TaxID=1522189 RepID=A0A316VU49_9BASI|nr:hypothetical protein IE81DRAFT_186383 [Ceraceosorus guamensis]PWN41146.1 hypothetical protein IE81DRAFT_186383 [Ceraceosorus guamensis]